MSENIEDYGAEPNPNDPSLASAEQNRQAIEDAANAAGTNGTIYVPEGTYYYGSDDIGTQIAIGPREPEGINWVGDGPEKSVLATTEHMDPDNTSHVMVKYQDGDHGQVSIKDLGWDGNQFNVGNLVGGDNRRIGIFFSFDEYADVTVDNCRFVDAYGPAMRVDEADLTMTFCDVIRNAVQQRKDGQVGGHALRTGPGSVLIEDCYFENGAAFVTDHSEQNGVTMRRCYVEGAGWGLQKLGSGEQQRFENVYCKLVTEYLKDVMPDRDDPNDETKGNRMLQRLPHEVNGGEAVHFDNVLIEDTWISATNIRSELEVTGDKLEIYNANIANDGHSSNGAWRASDNDGTTNGLYFNNFGTLSVHDTTGYAINIRGDAKGTGSIDTLERSNNTDGLGNTDNITINDDRSGGNRIDIDHPSKDEVGVNSSEEDDEEAEPEAPLFEDWTPRWESESSDWSINDTASNVGGAVLELAPDSPGRHALSYGSVGEVMDADILGLTQVPADEDGDSSWCRLIGRGSGTAGNETGYFVAFRDEPQLDIVKYLDGDASSLASERIDDHVGTWMYVRFNIEGERVRARFWEYGDDEPDDWDLEVTDGDIKDPGWVGTGGWSTDTQQWDSVSVGTGGESAQFVGSNPPDVSWETPTDGESVTGNIMMQVDASDIEDPDDSLAVEYRIDDDSWSVATYNPETGYYEDEWDSTAVGDGKWTLEARATDSLDDTSKATVDVTVDNGSNISVESVATRNVSDSAVTLVGELIDLGSSDEADVGFLWRESEQNSWTTAGEQTLSSAGEFTTEISGLNSDTEHEFRAVVSAPEELKGDIIGFQTNTVDENVAPAIDQFEITNHSDSVWTRFDVDWVVSDREGKLDRVVTELLYEGVTVDAESTGVSGERAGYTHGMRVRGDVDEIQLSVNDTENEVQTESKDV